jgi:hypothetical protein
VIHADGRRPCGPGPASPISPTIAVFLDGTSKGTVNAFSASRQAQQTVYSVSGLPVGRHTLTLTKTGGAYMVIDRFDVG